MSAPASATQPTDGPTWTGFLATLPDLALASQFLLVWVDPSILGLETISLFVGLMVAEFIVIHSSVFLGNVLLEPLDRASKTRKTLLLSLLYSLFFLAISAAVGQWYYLFGFWLLIANRLLGVWLGQAPSGEERALIQRGWAATTIFYLVGVFLTLLLPLPTLGLTPAIASSHSLPGEGIWVDEPHRAIAFGLFYYAMVGWSELSGHRWFSGASVTKA